MGDTPILFGKYKDTGKTFADILDEDKEYCKWILKEGTGNFNRNLGAFIKFLRDNRQELDSDDEPIINSDGEDISEE
jgi:hypothetical protein